ncbi:hypothetical protein Sta7437_0787 [Stanieria cyanosphaera PCC 7437]|uniref:Glycoside hydrolase family 5 domain-containing protein n=1 Tax=Stanieria cyanosphaera (strain ATCC 29371 / PCC 7437) TaxID=111780 RepID=K9XPC0_STAC7|nr:hypothetical protein [Stanieria cyanosphaera]AFZ34378.1 hypothetical protein Sta7437_0787 [Stanieria cyanosphaera PCC 7437]
MKYFKFLAIACFTLLFALYAYLGNAGTLSTAYIDPAYLTSVPFGSHSHWIQPWRAYMETVPAKQFLNGIGVVWNVESAVNPELVAHMLAKYGFKRVRVEIGWGLVDVNDETQIVKVHADRLKNILVALKKYNLRPLILLNAHHGGPCPLTSIQLTLNKNASAGDTKIELNSTNNLQSNYSGISNIGNGIAAEYLITNITGNTVTLSKPLPKNLTSGTSLKIDTLKYRPFSIPGSSDYQKTMVGWNKYIETVAKFVTNSLGTSSSNNKGFDLEIWNELTFGSNFLYINKYYTNEPYQYEQNNIWNNLVKETVTYINAHSTNFAGVQISNGFSNTIPWSASSQQPARINAISKHPYPPKKSYPQDEYPGKKLNAFAQEDSFIPTYSVYFPEYIGTALQTETIIRDIAPINNEFYGIKHGRYARVFNGKVFPVPVWITEINVHLEGSNPNVSIERALAIKAKAAARFFCFYLNKGVTQVHLYGASGGDKSWGIIQDNFIQYAKQSNSVYPLNEEQYVSPSLKVVSRIVNQIKKGVDHNLTLKTTQPLQIVSIKDTHDHYQFKGDGTTAHPNLYDRDVFTFLPFQVNANKLIIPYYVMTRDVQQDLTPEKFTVEITGIKDLTAVSVYDPINDKNIPVKFSQNAESNSFSLELIATDYPYLLTLKRELVNTQSQPILQQETPLFAD